MKSAFRFVGDAKLHDAIENDPGTERILNEDCSPSFAAHRSALRAPLVNSCLDALLYRKDLTIPYHKTKKT